MNVTWKELISVQQSSKCYFEYQVPIYRSRASPRSWMVGGFISWGASRPPLAKVHTTTTYNKYQEQVTYNPALEFIAWKPRKQKWKKSMALLAGSKLKRWSLCMYNMININALHHACWLLLYLLWRLLSPLPALFLILTLPRMLLLHVVAY